MTQDQRKDLYRILGSAALLGAGLLVTQPVVKIGLHGEHIGEDHPARMLLYPKVSAGQVEVQRSRRRNRPQRAVCGELDVMRLAPPRDFTRFGDNGF